MNNITVITDYKGNFGSKWKSEPYRSGYNKAYIQDLFKNEGYDVRFISYAEVDFSKNWEHEIVLYTSSEEYEFLYKKFIEDVIQGLQLARAILIPDPIFLKANNNKVFSEILRNIIVPKDIQTIQANIFGTYEELKKEFNEGKIPLPCVLKMSEGAMSKGVFLARSQAELEKIARKISSSFHLNVCLKEVLRSRKYPGYRKESLNQHKFIVQPFIADLTNDWKVLIYGNKYFVLRRNIRSNDFRASGSGYKYKAGSEAGFPTHMFELVKSFYDALNVPNASIDFAYDGKNGYIFEFQAIYFGTSTQYKSKDYFEYNDGKWLLVQNNYDQEQIFVKSIVEFMKKLNA